MATPAVLAGALESALNAYLRLDPDAAAGLGPLAGRTVLLRLEPPGLGLLLTPGADGSLRVREEGEGEAQARGDVRGDDAPVPDVTVEGSPLALMKLARGQGAGTPAAQAVKISGDIHTAQSLQAWLGGIDPDWEELLARVLGDVPAYQAGRLVRSLAAGGRQAGEKLRRDLADYLRYERGELPAPEEVEHFLDEVGRLRDDVERMSARVQRLRGLMPDRR